jgi:peroxiredoxin
MQSGLGLATSDIGETLALTLLIARFALAAIFMVAGVAKLLDRAGSRAAIAGFGVPKSFASPLSIALPIIELLVAIALIPAASSLWAAWAALLLLAVFIAGIAGVMIRGREAECHCFGQLHSSRVGFATLARNIGLAVVAGVVIVLQRSGSSPGYVEWLGGLTGGQVLALYAGVSALAIVAAGAWFMVQLLRQHGRMLLRLDTLEEELAARGILGDPSRTGSADGLVPGVVAPTFALPDLRGGTTTLNDLLVPGLPLMLVFAHPGCSPCVAMLPEIGAWESAHGTDLTFALISQGDVEANRAVVAEQGIEHVLIQTERRTADDYEAWATPSAVLVSREGLIASPVAQGAAAMRVLLSTAVATVTSDLNGDIDHSHNGNGNGASPKARDAPAATSGRGANGS